LGGSDKILWGATSGLINSKTPLGEMGGKIKGMKGVGLNVKRSVRRLIDRKGDEKKKKPIKRKDWKKINKALGVPIHL